MLRYLDEPKCVYDYITMGHKVLAKQLVNRVAHKKFQQNDMLVLKA
jgi:hypothetical protein